SPATLWRDRCRTGRIDIGFRGFEAWRDAQLAEEEVAQHKLDRKIVREEHWVRYGVTARRKRNMRRMGELQAMRDARRTYRGTAGTAAMAASDADLSGKLVVEAKGIGKTFPRR